jgi:hypothetical protein
MTMGAMPVLVKTGAMPAGMGVTNPAAWAGQIDRGTKNGWVRGMCDPTFSSIRQAALPWRHSRAVFAFNIDSATQISLETNAQVILLNQGNNNGPSQGYPNDLTLTETDANNDGALTKRLAYFKIRGMGYRVLRPFVFNPVAIGNKIDHSIFDGYEEAMARFILDGTAIKGVFKDEDCNLDFDNPADWAQPAGPASKNIVTNGFPVGPAMMQGYRGVVMSGPRDSNDQITFQVTVGRGIQIQRPNSPIPLQQFPVGTKLNIELDLLVYGEPVCACELCPVDLSNIGLLPAQLSAVQEAFGYIPG